MLIKRFFGFMGTRGHVQRDVDIFSKNGSQLAFLIRVASKKDAKDQHFWNSVLRHVPYVLYKANGRTLSHIANGLARAGVNDKGTWDSILHRYYQIRDETKCEDLVLLGNALSKVLNDSQPILRDIANRIRSIDDEINPRYIAVLLKAFAVSNYRDHHLIDALLQQVISQSACMTMASIAILLDGLYNLGYLENGALKCLSMQLMHILTSHNVLENAVISKLSVNQEGELINAQVGEGVRAADGIGNHCSGGSDESEFLELRADDRTTLHATETTRDIQQSKWKRLTGLKKIETRHLALIHRAYAHSTFLNKKLMDTIFETMIQLEKRFQPIEIVMVVNSMARSKMHNKQLVNLFSKRILKDYKRFTLDMLSVFLNGICMPNDNDRDFFDRILSLIIRKFNGQIDAKHALTLIQVITKVKLPVGENSRILCQQLLNEHDVLDPLELTNAVAYLSKLYPNLAEIRHLVDMYLEIYDENDEIRNPQQLAILYYALSRLHDPPYDECRHRILNLIERSNFDHFDPIHVANILRAMSLHSIYQESLVNRFAVYIEDNMKRFSFQLLGSSLDSLCDLNYSGNTLWLKLCKLVNSNIRRISICAVPCIKKPIALRDLISYMRFLTTAVDEDTFHKIDTRQDMIEAFVTLSNLICDAGENDIQCDDVKSTMKKLDRRFHEKIQMLKGIGVESEEKIAMAAAKLKSLSAEPFRQGL